jgi:hypothetical protein
MEPKARGLIGEKYAKTIWAPLPFLTSPDPDNADAALLLRSFEDICHQHECPTKRRAKALIACGN